MVVTRFAPSPTGYLHIGSARTALFCWLWAKKTGGKFILRIEDTDLERSTQEAVDVILEGMNWLNLNWDEGPFYQTKRFDRYKEVIAKLVQEGKAYKCYCSKERLDALREQQIKDKEKPRYDGHCRHNPQDKDQPHVVRFKTPEAGEVVINDLVKGKIVIQNKELDDLIILRTDGAPTYNFTVVVDDWDMGVTHVLRGDDHINNTPRQIHILEALGAKLPLYGHMPMLLGPTGKKLSKRDGAASVLDYREEGYLPEALINYLVRLGWSHGDQEIFSIEDLKEFFDVNNIQAAPAAINPDKLLWINQHYLKTMPASEIALRLRPFLEKEGCDLTQGPQLEAVVEAQRERSKTLVEMAQKSKFWFVSEIEMDPSAVAKNLDESCLPGLKAYVAKLNLLKDWTPENIHQALHEVTVELDIKLGKIAQPIRVAVCGNTISPPIDITLGLLGKLRTLERLQNVILKLSN